MTKFVGLKAKDYSSLINDDSKDEKNKRKAHKKMCYHKKIWVWKL